MFALAIAAVMPSRFFGLAGCSRLPGSEGATSEPVSVQEDPDDSTGRYARVGDITSFETTTLAGESFSQDNFAPYDLTMVNIWSTTCGFCIDEMPALESLSQSLPENGRARLHLRRRLVNADAARGIVEAQGVTYPCSSITIGSARCFFEGERNAHDHLRRQHGRSRGRCSAGRSARGDADAVADAYRKLVDEHLAELA